MRFFRAVLFLFPRAFRDEYGEAMTLLVEERRRAASGSLERLGLWLEVVPDAVVTAAQVQLDFLRQDARAALRSYRRSPGLALTAVAVMGLGIGANAGVFSVADRVLFRPLPYDAPSRLVLLWEREPRYSRVEPSPPNYRDWREMSSSFEAMAAFNPVSVNVVGWGEPRLLLGAAVTGELFPLLGVAPLLGRFLTPEDERFEAEPAAVLSFACWQALFGASPDVLGTSIRLDDTAHTVVGVMPPDFAFPTRSVEVWIPKRLTEVDFEDRDNNYLKVVARLAPGVSLDEARSDLDVVTARLEEDYPEENAQTGATVHRLRDEIGSRARGLLLALSGASLCLLLVACTNLASLLLARAMERRRELALRGLLGAGRERLVRQLATESLLLSAAGGGLGLVLGTASAPLLSALVPGELPVAETLGVDLRVLGFAAVLAVAVGLGVGTLPALGALSRGAAGLGDRSATEGGDSGDVRRLRSGLVVAQLAVTVALLVASGLLVRALWRVQAVDTGFSTEEVLAVYTPLPMSRYADTERRVELFDRVLSEVGALPGVSSAAYVSFLPLEMGGGIWDVEVPGVPEDESGPETASLRFVTPGFFETMGIPLREGRDVSASDELGDAFVAVVSESFVRRFWPGESGLGRSFQFAFEERTIVGVVGDIRVRGLERASEPQVYLPYRQVPDGALFFYAPKELVVRSASEPAALAAPVGRVIRRVDPELPLAEVRTLEDVVRAETAPRAAQLRVLGAFTALALALAGVGVYGLTSFSVSRRRSELGLRMALGASSRDVLGAVVGEGAALALAGIGLGALAGYVAARTLDSLLAGVAPGSAGVYAIAAFVVLLVALAGCAIPALRAARLDPTEALRSS